MYSKITDELSKLEERSLLEAKKNAIWLGQIIPSLVRHYVQNTERNEFLSDGARSMCI